MRHSPAPEDDFDPDYISKSEQKRAMDRLQAIGEQLAALPQSQLKKLPLSETLMDAFKQLPSMKSHEAIRRHKQLIGKLMRHEDEAAILQALNRHQQPNLDKQIEILITRLLQHGDPAIADFVRNNQAAERHTLRQLVRAAAHSQETEPEQATRHRIRLATYLREVLTLSAG
ncbi:ribosome-associated protein [Fluviicoccus keumensis]|uniref:Ribosome-associated protein n=1 Tax=Fluviicoccus keumensis TaxID=1435465 RepID=A0A4Q7Z3R4_9GAMM|nr:ribosome biogenesis factor YjgA [Fluviicoccus keumensis]RZU44930.1 ribosome-associated protein [Fluviicoccus keumensis]